MPQKEIKKKYRGMASGYVSRVKSISLLQNLPNDALSAYSLGPKQRRTFAYDTSALHAPHPRGATQKLLGS